MPHLSQALHLSPRQIGVAAVGITAAIGVGLYAYLRKSPDPDELERLRRLHLAEEGRITDATLIDTSLQDAHGSGSARTTNPPSVLLYQYRVAGVGYESAQDVSSLADQLQNLRVDLPIQVRYDPHNPADSIVVAESWSGLRLDPDASGPTKVEFEDTGGRYTM